MEIKLEKTLKEYIEDILNSKYSNDIIQNEKFQLQIVDFIDDKEYVTDTNVISLDKLKYIQLVTKLETFIKIFDILQKDNNVVCCDEIINDFNSFKDRIIQKIEEGLDKEEDQILL
jgi:hypothetical protein